MCLFQTIKASNVIDSWDALANFVVNLQVIEHSAVYACAFRAGRVRDRFVLSPARKCSCEVQIKLHCPILMHTHLFFSNCSLHLLRKATHLLGRIDSWITMST